MPPNDLARLMYYLKCISCAINYNDVNKYTDFQKYHLLSQDDRTNVYALAILLSPKMFLDANIFIISPKLLTRGLDNQFLQITDDRIGVHVNQEIAIKGRIVKVSKVMVCNERWLDFYYYQPLAKLCNNNNNIGFYSSSSSTCCTSKMCINIIIIMVILFFLLGVVKELAKLN